MSNLAEKPEADGEISNHKQALELWNILSIRLDETGLKQINTIVNNVVLGPYRSERTEKDMAENMGKTRDEVRTMLNENILSEEEAVAEVARQAEKIGIRGLETETFMKVLLEYVRLMHRETLRS